MFNFIKTKMDNYFTKQLIKRLKTANYTQLKHEALQHKWEALKDKNEEGYESWEWYEELLDILEKGFSKGGNDGSDN